MTSNYYNGFSRELKSMAMTTNGINSADNVEFISLHSTIYYRVTPFVRSLALCSYIN